MPVLPLAVLLLLIMPAGAIYAAFRAPSGWWAGLVRSAGCLASMGFAFVYLGLIAGVTVVEIFREGVGRRGSCSWLAHCGPDPRVEGDVAGLAVVTVPTASQLDARVNGFKAPLDAAVVGHSPTEQVSVSSALDTLIPSGVS